MIFAILSFLSAVFLPGSVIFGILESINKIPKNHFNISFFIIFSFIVSCCFNFMLIYFLVSVGIYTKSVVISIFMLEIIAFLYLFKDRIFLPLKTHTILLNGTRREKILFAISILIALYFLNKCLQADIFWHWDAVVSWDRWASEWTRGKFVLNEGGYSQLYPMLLSLGYTASGQISSFQGIGVAIYWYFVFVCIVASLFLLKDNEIFGDKFTHTNYFGIVLCAMIYFVFFVLSNEFYVGYVDMPCAMMIIISALLLIKAKQNITQSNATLFLLLASLSAGISTEIKQAGLFWCGIYAIALIAFFRTLGAKKLLLNIFIMLLFLAPWVIIAIYKKLVLHTPATNIEYTWDRIYLGKGYLERFQIAIKRYKKIAEIFMLCVLTLGIRNKIFALLGIAGIAYFIFWGTHLSYDLRNLQGGLALMIIAVSAIVVYYFEMLLKILPFIYKRIGVIFCIFVVCGVIIAYFSEERTLKNEYKRKMKLGGEDTNKLVFSVFDKHGSKPLLTSNQLIAYLPDFDRKYYKHYSFGEHRKDGEFEAYATALKQKEGSFYILLPNKDYERYKDFLKDAIYFGKSQHYSLVLF